MNRIALSATLALSGLLASTEALALDEAACCVQGTSKIDNILNPARGSDEKFFGRAGGPPNILFILDNSGSMEGQGGDPSGAWPAQWPTTKGCNWSVISNLGYSKNVTYAKMKNSVTSNNPDVDNWFPSDKFFDAPLNGYGNNFKKDPWDIGGGNAGTKYDSADSACASPIPAADTANCKTCLQTAGYFIVGQSSTAFSNVQLARQVAASTPSHNWQMADSDKRNLDPSVTPVVESCGGSDTNCGTCTYVARSVGTAATNYTINMSNSRLSFSEAGTDFYCVRMSGAYLTNSDERRVSGNFLNFYAPRDSGSVSVLTNIVVDLKEVRFALHTLNRNAPSENCFWSNDGGCIVNKIGPSCAKSYPWDQSSCDSNRNSILNVLTSSISFASGTPIAGALYSAGYFFADKTLSGPTPATGYSTSWTPAPTTFNDADSVCFSCGFNAIILLSDGEPNTPKPNPLPAAMQAMTASANAATGSPGKVAEYLWTHDLRGNMAGVQKVATYTIGFSVNAAFSATLQEIASKGGGTFYPATSTQDLRDAVLLIIEDIARRNTSFSTSNIASVQSGQSSMAAVLPRMMPMSGKPWTGDLYRFELYNEWVFENDKNGDGDKDDVFIVDKDGSIVVEDTEGKFVKKGGATPANPFWEARDRLITNGHAARKIYTVVDAGGASGDTTKDGYFTEHDNANGLIEFKHTNWNKLIDYLGIKGTGMCPTGQLAGEQGAFLGKLRVSVATTAAAIKATTAYDFMAIAAPTQADYDELCARIVIQYIRGQDLDDEDNDNSRTDTRKSVLGDIFHSSPQVVDPPVGKDFCLKGGNNQCVRTLFDQNLGLKQPVKATELEVTNEDHCGVTQDWDAYDMYRWNNRKRSKPIVVGANDGMLHAFSGGTELGTGSCSNGDYSPVYDAGTGDELWAFIAPDALPRLADIVLSHQFYVDGDSMIRDIWVDGSGSTGADGKKQWDEFHTVAIIAEGRGGTHYFALELKWDANFAEVAAPAFRWMYPQPCTAEAGLFGKTLFALSPKAPPMGPVLLDTSTVTGLQGIKRHGTGAGDPTTTERYVAFLSGGWSPSLEKGRGVYMVDAWSGFVQGRHDNLWWKFARGKEGTDTGEMDSPKVNLTHSIVAPVGMVDFGPNEGWDLDGFFDLGVVGDTRGQIWTMRFYEPGKWNTTDKTIENWSGGRAFEPDIEGVSASADEVTAVATNAKSVRNDWPIYYLTETTLQIDTGALRGYVGSGDRYSILEDKVGQCRWDNPLPCSKLGCDEYKTVYRMKRLDKDYSKVENHWKDQQFEHAKLEMADANLSACGTNAGEIVVEASIAESKINACPGAGANYDPVRNMTVKCGREATDVNTFNCKRTDTVAPNFYDINTSTTDTDATYMANLGKNRFYGFWLYGKKVERMFDESRTTASDANTKSAKGYDAARLTDRAKTPTVNSYGNLVDVTDISCLATSTSDAPNCKYKTSGTATTGATPSGMGWFYEYVDGHKFRTATGAAVANGCTMWSSLYPVLSGESACANTVAKSRFYQSHYVTGLPLCAAGMKGLTKTGTYACTGDTDCLEGGHCVSGKCDTFGRFVEASALTPPPEPKVVTQISVSGQIKTSAMTPPEAGKDQVSSIDIAKSEDVVQPVYELPLSRRMHQCRHEDKTKCVSSPP
ncbi:MAG TPA: pilus assembly protein PilY [Myxococcales bacterium]